MSCTNRLPWIYVTYTSFSPQIFKMFNAHDLTLKVLSGAVIVCFEPPRLLFFTDYSGVVKVENFPLETWKVTWKFRGKSDSWNAMTTFSCKKTDFWLWWWFTNQPNFPFWGEERMELKIVRMVEQPYFCFLPFQFSSKMCLHLKYFLKVLILLLETYETHSWQQESWYLPFGPSEKEREPSSSSTNITAANQWLQRHTHSLDSFYEEHGELCPLEKIESNFLALPVPQYNLELQKVYQNQRVISPVQSRALKSPRHRSNSRAYLVKMRRGRETRRRPENVRSSRWNEWRWNPPCLSMSSDQVFG